MRGLPRLRFGLVCLSRLRFGLVWVVSFMAASGSGVGPTVAADLFVDNVRGNDLFSGDGAESGPTGGGPLRTIGEALRRSHKRDRIVLANSGQPYRESISLSTGRHSGDSLQPFIIVGNGATLDGSAPAPESEWQHVPKSDTVFRSRPPRLAYQQLFLDDRPLNRVPTTSLSPGLPALEPLQWCMYNGAMYFRPEPGKWIDGYNLSQAVLPVGITLYKVRNVTIVDLVIQGYQLDGINAHDTQDCRLLGITCRGNGRSGIASVGAARLTIEDCISGDNGVAQLLTEGYSITQVVDSQLIGNTAPAVLRRGGKVYVQTSPAKMEEPKTPASPEVEKPPEA